MKDLILSLSMEPTDTDRRTRVKDVFEEALARPNGMPKRFSDLFDAVLAEVGDEIQREAKRKFFEAQEANQTEEKEVAPSDEESASDDDSGGNKDKGGELKLKTPEELQLWALVDMMVQSKTIVKTANGELGSKGNFQ